MRPYGYVVEGDGLICADCVERCDEIAIEVDSEGYPDGYTCADCGVMIEARVSDEGFYAWRNRQEEGK